MQFVLLWIKPNYKANNKLEQDFRPVECEVLVES